MVRFLVVCLAGAVGSGARYLVGLWGNARWPSFPGGTLIVNLVGCFLIALVMELALRISTFPPTLRFGLTSGFIGGLTTYSSFNYETSRLLEDGHVGAGLANLGVTLVGCAIMGMLGLVLARQLS